MGTLRPTRFLFALGSQLHSFYLFQEVDIWLIGNPRTLHGLPQVIGLVEPPSLLQVLPLKQDDGLVGVVCVAPESPSLGAASR